MARASGAAAGDAFFDKHPMFQQTSNTASSRSRLNLRHQALIEANNDILQGARVLDLASHDGRWSFAALEAGAAHVTGIEARRSLVDNANTTFAEYGVEPDRYGFICADLFEALAQRRFDVDVVLCFGFVYHTLRYPDLFRGILDAAPKHVLIDTKVARGEDPTVQLLVNHTEVESNAAEDSLSHARRVVAGWPSLSALRLMLDVYDFDVESQFDWPSLLATRRDALPGVRDYHNGARVSLRCRARPDSAVGA